MIVRELLTLSPPTRPSSVTAGANTGLSRVRSTRVSALALDSPVAAPAQSHRSGGRAISGGGDVGWSRDS